jgi:hypothetical protein
MGIQEERHGGIGVEGDTQLESSNNKWGNGGGLLTSSRERKIEIRRFPPRLRTARTRHAVLTRSV